MRRFVVVVVMACAACRKERLPPRENPADASPPPEAPEAGPEAGPVVEEPPPEAAPAGVRIVRCRSSNKKYVVDLSLHGREPQPRTARVLIDGRGPPGGDEGVAHGGRFPAPGALTCSKSDDPSSTGCYVANTSDYGYIVDVHLDKQGKRTVELRKNGVASTHLANLDCEK